MKERSANMVISSSLLLAALLVLGVFFLCATGAVYLTINAWGRWGW